MFAILTFQACSVKPEIRYVDKPYRVNVPVKCIIYDANCSFNRPTDTGVISAMLECIVDMKHNEEKCK